MKMRFTDLTRKSVSECTAQTVAGAINAGFEGYVVPMHLTAEQYERRFRPEHLDALASTIWFAGERPAILSLICRRGRDSRMAAFGVASPFRSQGLARHAVVSAVDEARARGDRRMVLEVIDGNTHAIKLYESCGFVTMRKLAGYEWSPPPAAPSAMNIHEIDIATAALMMSNFSDQNLTWQLSPATHWGHLPPIQAFALGDTAVAFIDKTAETARLRGIAVDPLNRRKGHGRTLLLGLARSASAQRWAIPAIVPEELGRKFLTSLGWQPSALSQHEMVHPLT